MTLLWRLQHKYTTEETINLIPDDAIKTIFESGRSHRYYLDRKVDEMLLQRIYELAILAPSASNLCPLRVTFVVSENQKAKVIEAAAEGNKAKIKSAPVVAIIAHDVKYYDLIEKLSPHMDGNAFRNKSDAELTQIAIENSWLQAGLLIAAVRSLGLDSGAMSGFDKNVIDDYFYKNSSWRSNFLLNIGYGDETELHPRGPRPSFEEACQIL